MAGNVIDIGAFEAQDATTPTPTTHRNGNRYRYRNPTPTPTATPTQRQPNTHGNRDGNGNTNSYAYFASDRGRPSCWDRRRQNHRQTRPPAYLYIITVRNYGPDTAINAVVNDVLSSGSTFVSARANRGRFRTPRISGRPAPSLGTLGDILNHRQESSQIIVTVIARGNTTITNTATVSSLSDDPNNAQITPRR